MSFFKNLFYKYLKPLESPPAAVGGFDKLTASGEEKTGEPMTTPADTLVTKHPDRSAQLTGPVYDYLKPMMPFSTVPQDLYMAVFYPKARKWPPNTEFSESVKAVNPGIKTVKDYIDKVEAASKRSRPVLTEIEDTALRQTASKLGVPRDSLYKLVNFESGWDPQATNRYTGARGLIQFMPKTAAGMGYAVTAAILPLLVVGGIVYFLLRRQGLI